MSPREALLGLVGVIGLNGLAVGEPPMNPLVEGREPNPVACQFYQAEGRTGGYVAALEAHENRSTDSGIAFPALVWDVLLDHLTFPLGRAVRPSSDAGGA